MRVIVIGAGPAGEAAAGTLKRLDKSVSVTLIEKDQAGGLCLNRGCVPSKALLEAVRESTEGGKPVSWPEIQALKTQVVQGIRAQLEARLKREGVTLVKGTAVFSGPKTIQINTGHETKTLEFDKALIAAGTEIHHPTALRPHEAGLLTSDSALELTHTPASVAVVGGGAIGCEFACLLHAAGSQVTLIEMKPGLLPGEDPAVSAALGQSFEKRGIAVKTGTTVAGLEKQSEGWNITLSDGGKLQVDHVLSCTGRVPASDSLGLEAAGVECDAKTIKVNQFLQTTNPSIYAAGDVAGSRLAHHASALGETAAANMLGGNRSFDDRFVPRCLYSWPEVASVGAWKYQLEEQGKPVKAARAFFKGSSKALAAGDTDGFVQIVSDPESRRILGAQIIGPHATELIHIFCVALKAEMTTQTLSEVIFAHPTLGELIKDAAKK